MKKKIVSIILSLLMVLSIFNVGIISAFADTPESYSIDFSEYALNIGSGADGLCNARNEAGVWSVEDDATAKGQKVLKFDSTKGGTAATYYAFLLNPTGSIVNDGKINLTKDKEYKIKLRLKFVNVPANKVAQFRLLTTNAFPKNDVTYYVPGKRNDSSYVQIFTKQNSFDWTEYETTFKFGVSCPSLLGCLCVTGSSSENSSNVLSATDWQAYLDYVEITEVVNEEEPEEPQEPEYGDLSAEYRDNSSKLNVNFDNYVVSDGNNVRAENGTFSIKSEQKGSTDGKVLSFVRDKIPASNATHNGLYLFNVNQTGAYNQADRLQLDSGLSYKMTIRYKVTNPDANAASQKWQFYFWNTEHGMYTAKNRDAVDANTKRVVVFKREGDTSGYVTESYSFIAPQYADGRSVQLLAGFVPVNSFSSNVDSAVITNISGYEWDIDYIYLSPIDPNPMNIDFNGYIINDSNVRSDYGNFTIDADADTEDKAALKYVKTNYSNNQAVYLFNLNQTGSASSNGALKLEKDKGYDMTIRYKITGGADTQKWQFRLLHTTNNCYTPRDRNDSNNDNLGAAADKTVAVFSRIGATDGYVTGTFHFTGAVVAENCTLLACLIPVNEFAFSTANVTNVANWSYSIDYIKIKEAEYSFTPQHMSVDFSDWNAQTGTAGAYYVTDTYTKTEWSTENDNGNKYIKFAHSKNYNVTDPLFYSVLMSPTGASQNGNADKDSYYSLVEGARYRISFKYKVNSPAGEVPLFVATTRSEHKTANLRIAVENDKNGNEIPTSDTRTDEFAILEDTNGQWKEYTFEFIAKNYHGNAGEATGNHMGITFYDNHMTQRDFEVCLDDVVVDRLSECYVSDVDGNAYNIFGIPASLGYYSDSGFNVCEAEKLPINNSKKVGEKFYFTDADYSTQMADDAVFEANSITYYYKVNGELNFDGNIDLLDLVTLKKHFANTDKMTPMDDVNCDKLTDSSDLSSLKTYLLTAVEPQSEPETEDLVLGVEYNHPGVPGYDAKYDFVLTYLGEKVTNYTLKCDEGSVIVNGQKALVPASFKDTTSKKSVKFTATYNGKTATFDLPITNWSLTFNDEFEGTSLDKTKWNTTPEKKNMYDGQVTENSAKHITVENGNLVMPVKKAVDRDDDGVDYESSQVTTFGTFSQKYGCFTVKMKGPDTSITSGANNAFWLLPAFGKYGTRYLFEDDEKLCGEWDIVERSAYWGQGKWRTTFHTWDKETGEKDASNTGITKTKYEDTADGYIEYTAVWTEDAAYVYVNGELCATKMINVTATGVPAAIILSNAINASTPGADSWTGYTTDDKLDELTVYVDYVRVYKAN